MKTWSSELFQDEEYRIKIVSSLKSVDRVMLAVDNDSSVCWSIRKIVSLVREAYGQDTQIIFWKWWDRFANNIPEVDVCNELWVGIKDWLWAKIDNSSVYRAKRI